MTTIVHAPSCPTLTTGGASGPCLCIPKREGAPKFVPRQSLMKDSPRSRPSDRHRHVAVNTAVEQLRSVGKRWKDAREWAIDQDRPGARAMGTSAIDPGTVAAYVAYLAAEAADQ